MPHIILEYSANLDAKLDMSGLCTALKDAAAATGVFPPAGIRVRAFAASHVIIADADPGHGFIDITLRLAHGRDGQAKTLALDAVFDAARAYTADVMAHSPFMLSAELREIDGQFSRKASSIRDYLPPEMH
ncbi:5-carboxymethyl-2-hydroxymuconate isomerase [uncultured Tateyamaria sp.]|uniref:5-carboxymethyl-2-hydroxymuconate isomerase n=1 Tax=uncultured Tateyamaria sp. TaxID=455651 RepID=UPI002604892C|nr:5-carboxymethyl-2-hydroxymuconate isomerase [uncultured Tateyamaria sp.]